MIPIIKKALKRIFSSNRRKQIRRCRRHIKSFLNPKKKVSLSEIRSILVDDFGLAKGDKIIVSSSFGNLNADFSPKEMVELLMNIIGPEGLIMMPFYPPVNSTEWALKHETFDMRNNKSSMGVLTNVFAHMPDVFMSKHPIKAVCAWGKGAEDIVKDHDKSTTPFYWDSPYGRLLKIHSKSLGVGARNMLPMHTIEDVLTEPIGFYYQKEKYALDIIDKDGNRSSVTTFVHDENILSRCVSSNDYIASLNCKTFKMRKVGYQCLCTIDNDDLYNTCIEQFKKGHTRLKK